MSKKILDSFFKKNNFDEDSPSAYAIADFLISSSEVPEFMDKLSEITDEEFEDEPEHKEKIFEEKSEIEALNESGQIIRIMRRSISGVNQCILAAKALEFEDEIVPQAIKMLKTSTNDSFIENATFFLSKCKSHIADELIRCFDDVRDSYARSMVLLILGYKGDETLIPWLIEKYHEMEMNYPDDDFHGGAYYALIKLEQRFYS